MASKAKDSGASCQAVTTQAGQTLFLMASWGASSFDIKVTDAQRSWQGSDISAPRGHRFPSDEWMLHAKEALFDLSPTRTFTFESFDLDDGQGLRLNWTSSYQGTEYVCGVSLPLAPDSGRLVSGMLVQLCHSYKVMQEAVSQVDKHNAELLSELKRVQNQALEQVEASTRREADMYLKFNLLLNSKTDYINQLRAKLPAAAAEEDEEAEGEQAGPGPSSLALPAPPGAGAAAAAAGAAGAALLGPDKDDEGDEDGSYDEGETTEEGNDLMDGQEY